MSSEKPNDPQDEPVGFWGTWDEEQPSDWGQSLYTEEQPSDWGQSLYTQNEGDC